LLLAAKRYKTENGSLPLAIQTSVFQTPVSAVALPEAPSFVYNDPDPIWLFIFRLVTVWQSYTLLSLFPRKAVTLIMYHLFSLCSNFLAIL
jgi:hypothetical protein